MTKPTPRPQITIVGGGISGLTAAYLLRHRRPDWSVTLVEKEPRLGGKVRSSTRNGFTFDWGPNGFLTNVPETLDLATSLGLEPKPAAAAAKRRFIYRDGGLRPLPDSPPRFLTTELLSPFGKVRAALEVVRGKTIGEEETVYAFFRRHFGAQVADAFAQIAVSGITAGDARRLSVDALFPRFRALEQEHGSLIRGLIQAQREAKRSGKAPGRLTSFEGGISQLVKALERQVEAVRRAEKVTRLSPSADGYTLTTSAEKTLQADAVVLATPAFVTASLLEPFSPDAAASLKAIPYADVAVLGLGYDRIDVPHALDGFGFLVPRGEGVRALGVLWSSTLFPDRAPGGKVMLRVIGGGTLDPDFTALPEADLLATVRRDLRLTMGITAEPEFVEIARWPRGIPQYHLGHREQVEAAMRTLEPHPGLQLTGNAYYGVGVNDCVRDAHRVVGKLLKEIKV